MQGPIRSLGLSALVLSLAAASPARGQEEEKPKGWSDTAEFSYVATSGNTNTSTLGFKNKLWRTWDKSAFELNAGGVRVRSADARYAMEDGTGGFDVIEPDPKATAENYYLNGRYDRKITESFFWFAGAGWDRNEFAGIKNRYTGVGGVGNIWYDTETVRFRTDYSATITKQDDVIEDPTTDDTFFGLRFSWLYWHQFGETTTYGNDFFVDLNMDETDDWRLDMTNWVAVKMTDRLALKVSWQVLYDHLPSLEEIVLLDVAGVDTGTTVTNRLDELDQIFTASLVVNF